MIWLIQERHVSGWAIGIPLVLLAAIWLWFILFTDGGGSDE